MFILYNMNELSDISTNERTMYKYFTDENCIEIYDSCFELIQCFINVHPTAISEPNFNDLLYDNLINLMMLHFEEDILFTNYEYDELEHIIELAINHYFKDVMPNRSNTNDIMHSNVETNLNNTDVKPNLNNGNLETNLNDTDIKTNLNDANDIITKQINYIKTKEQPAQRTPEWYLFRHNLITASNAYKAFESQSTQNQLIYEKCKPLFDCSTNNNQTTHVNVNTTLHWGQKYEPISILIYEYLNNTMIEDFGCIQHDKYLFLGASPDGINVKQDSKIYGRMLEIKNIVNRDITGIPKKEYWIQTQLQMEVCNLNECDFLETKFIEYENSDSFWNDHITNVDIKDDEYGKFTNNNKLKGLLLYFNKPNGTPFYLYKPINITSYCDICKWEEYNIELYQSLKHNMSWINTQYWKLEEYSCVLILRNKEWFISNISKLSEIWDTIIKERTSGYEHRAPKRKVKKTIPIQNNTITNCFITINSDSKINVVKTL